MVHSAKMFILQLFFSFVKNTPCVTRLVRILFLLLYRFFLFARWNQGFFFFITRVHFNFYRLPNLLDVSGVLHCINKFTQRWLLLSWLALCFVFLHLRYLSIVLFLLNWLGIFQSFSSNISSPTRLNHAYSSVFYFHPLIKLLR